MRKPVVAVGLSSAGLPAHGPAAPGTAPSAGWQGGQIGAACSHVTLAKVQFDKIQFVKSDLHATLSAPEKRAAGMHSAHPMHWPHVPARNANRQRLQAGAGAHARGVSA